jgi:glycosyltransferase involved in cell wall biosynthesis
MALRLDRRRLTTMRVLVLTNMYPPHHYGGYELNCQEFVTSLRDAGHDVMVLTSDHVVPGVDTPPEHRDEVRRELKLYWRDHVVLKPSIPACLRIERSNQGALVDAVTSSRPDVVSVWHMGCMSLGLLAACHGRGLPVVHVVNDDWLIYGPRVDRWRHAWSQMRRLAPIGEAVTRVPCRPADLGVQGTYCFISEYTKRAAEEHGPWTFADATVGYCGINTDDFPIGRCPPRAKWGGRLLHVGRIDDRKGIDVAISALALLDPTTTLDIVGRGDDRHLDELQVLAQRLGVHERVSFRVAERSELHEIYSSADALLFPPRWAEPFGLVPIEAMASSTPVVATGTGGSSEFLVDERNCLLIPVDDAEALAAAVRRLADDGALRARLVDGGLTTARELTLDQWLGLLTDWHRVAAERFAHGRPGTREPIQDVLRRGQDPQKGQSPDGTERPTS